MDLVDNLILLFTVYSLQTYVIYNSVWWDLYKVLCFQKLMSNRFLLVFFTQVAHKLFQETGLFDTFRIPLPQFLNYFHALEMGYRNKPCEYDLQSEREW